MPLLTDCDPVNPLRRAFDRLHLRLEALQGRLAVIESQARNAWQRGLL